MKVKTLEVGQLAANCYLVYEEESGNALIIDPGDSAEYIENVIRDFELEPKIIIATHGHFDHVLAAEELRLVYDIPVAMNTNDSFLLKRARKTAKYFTGNDPKLNTNVNVDLKAGVFNNALFNIYIYETPGHTPGSVSLYFKKGKAVFVGDLVFAGGAVGRTDFEYCDKVELMNSINNILKLPDDVTLYPGHGDSTTIGELKGYII